MLTNKGELRAIDSIRAGIDECAKVRNEMEKREKQFKDMAKDYEREIGENEQGTERLTALLRKCKEGLEECEREKNAFEERLRKCGKDLTACENKLQEKIADPDDKNAVMSRMITYEDTKPHKCGSHAGYYLSSPEKQIGKHGFHTYDLLKEFFPDMYSNPKIKKALTEGAYPAYGAANYKFTFDSPISYAWGSPGNMWCYKCTNHPGELACQSDNAQSFCKAAGWYATTEYNKNFFTKVCPNLVFDYGGMATIKAKLTAPLILVDSSGYMIEKDGTNSGVTYGLLTWYLKSNGKMKNDCAGNSTCERLRPIMERVAWDTDKVVTLKISDNTGKYYTGTYSDDNQDIPVSSDISNII